MSETQTVIHVTQNSKYHLSIKRADTKGILGYTVEANGDVFLKVVEDLVSLKSAVEKIAVEPAVPVQEVK